MDTYTALREFLRLLWVGLLPVIAATVAAGALIGALQSVTTVRDHALGYGARFFAVSLALYLFLPGFFEQLVQFSRVVIGPESSGLTP